MKKTLMFKDKQRLNLFIDPVVAKKSKMWAASLGVSLSTFVETAIKEKLPKQIVYSEHNNAIMGGTSRGIDK